MKNAVNRITRSDEAKIKCGVPQDKILGPILFIIYTNDVLHKCGGKGLVEYTDDTTKWINGKNVEKNLTEAWSMTWLHILMKMNYN